jgi:hypothetical protein
MVQTQQSKSMCELTFISPSQKQTTNTNTANNNKSGTQDNINITGVCSNNSGSRIRKPVRKLSAKKEKKLIEKFDKDDIKIEFIKPQTSHLFEKYLEGEKVNVNNLNSNEFLLYHEMKVFQDQITNRLMRRNMHGCIKEVKNFIIGSVREEVFDKFFGRYLPYAERSMQLGYGYDSSGKIFNVNTIYYNFTFPFFPKLGDKKWILNDNNKYTKLDAIDSGGLISYTRSYYTQVIFKYNPSDNLVYADFCHVRQKYRKPLAGGTFKWFYCP